MNAVSRRVTASIVLDVAEPADLVFSVAAAATQTIEDERVELWSDGVEASSQLRELTESTGTRLHRIAAASPGRWVMQYAATVSPGGPGSELSELDLVEFTRPSRYVESDRLGEVSYAQFGDLRGEELVAAVVDWSLQQISYDPEGTDPVGGALDTYLRRRGVCRDTAHLVIAFLRSRRIPARLVSVYAPGLSPMDFHAVAEVGLDGRWWVVDGTGLAPRSALVRIATGRDAADTPFLTVNAGRVDLVSMEVTAVALPSLPADDGRSRVALS